MVQTICVNNLVILFVFYFLLGKNSRTTTTTTAARTVILLHRPTMMMSAIRTMHASTKKGHSNSKIEDKESSKAAVSSSAAESSKCSTLMSFPLPSFWFSVRHVCYIMVMLFISTGMPTIEEVCSSFDLVDVDIEFTDKDCQMLNLFQMVSDQRVLERQRQIRLETSKAQAKKSRRLSV